MIMNKNNKISEGLRTPWENIRDIILKTQAFSEMYNDTTYLIFFHYLLGIWLTFGVLKSSMTSRQRKVIIHKTFEATITHSTSSTTPICQHFSKNHVLWSRRKNIKWIQEFSMIIFSSRALLILCRKHNGVILKWEIISVQ